MCWVLVYFSYDGQNCALQATIDHNGNKIDKSGEGIKSAKELLHAFVENRLTQYPLTSLPLFLKESKSVIYLNKQPALLLI